MNTCRESAAWSNLHLKRTEVDDDFFSISCFNFLTSFQVHATYNDNQNNYDLLANTS